MVEQQRSSPSELGLDDAYPHYKVVLVGEDGVGKSSIYRRVKDGRFTDGTATTGLEDNFQTVRAIGDSGSKVRMNLWDTAGQEKYRAMTQSHYRGADAVVFVFSLDQSASLMTLKRWMDDANRLAPEGYLSYFVCNKIDLPDEEQVIYDSEIDSFFATNTPGQARRFQTSAKENTGIQEAINHVLSDLYASADPLQGVNDQSVRIDVNPLRPPMASEKSFYQRCCA